MTDYAATTWKCSVANAQKLTPNTTGSGSEKQTGGASLDIVRLLGDSSRKMSSRCCRGRRPRGQQRQGVAQKLGAALFAELGMESPVPVGSFLRCVPLSVLTTSTLAQLDGVRPQSRFDQRRFRMNVIVETVRPGFVENGWVGHELGFGGGARLNVALLDPQCVMTTLAQDGLPQDTDVLRTLVGHRPSGPRKRRDRRLSSSQNSAYPVVGRGLETTV
jgi:hypothetical protein